MFEADRDFIASDEFLTVSDPCFDLLSDPLLPTVLI